ncbi:MAG: YybH family protein [Thermomicrobiales bacterium]
MRSPLSSFDDGRKEELVVDDEQAIRALVERWMTASAAGDVETVLGLMTDDVVFSVPGQEPFGKEAFAAASQGLAGMTIDGTSEIVELQVLGDWAFIRNHIRLAITPRDASVVRRSGYTLTILRKGTDGQWRIARDANMVTTEPSET